VRSRIIASFLQNRYPQFEIRSFGIEVEPKNRISSSLTREMKKWGLEIDQTPPTSILTATDFLESSEFIISADAEISDYLSQKGYSSLNICEFALDKSHVPEDPINFKSDRYFANAAKVLHCASRMVSKVIENREETVGIVTFTSTQNGAGAPRVDAILIDARLRRISNEINDLETLRLFEEQEILDRSLVASLHNGTKFYSPKFEFREPERVLLSNDWSIFVNSVSKFGPVDVITTPLGINGRLLWEPYLASIVAERVEYL